MGSKIIEIASKIYKPEILICPKCGSFLKYKYAVSNKVVQFTSGKYFRIKNLGYACPNCNDNIYFSQTANKLCLKGCTYSTKIVCMIAYYKDKHYGRERICDVLASKGVVISDRNIDILYEKFLKAYNQDYDSLIKKAYQRMLLEFNEIRISLDLITVNDNYFVILYDYFDSKLLAIWRTNDLKSEEFKNILKEYIGNYTISVIASVRNTNNKFIPVVKMFASEKTKFLCFTKF